MTEEKCILTDGGMCPNPKTDESGKKYRSCSSCTGFQYFFDMSIEYADSLKEFRIYDNDTKTLEAVKSVRNYNNIIEGIVGEISVKKRRINELEHEKDAVTMRILFPKKEEAD